MSAIGVKGICKNGMIDQLAGGVAHDTPIENEIAVAL
jgi:hypothetical protein